MVHLILSLGKTATHGIKGRKGRRGFLRFVYKEAFRGIGEWFMETGETGYQKGLPQNPTPNWLSIEIT